jgi:class 3 adenylate cyclase
LARYFAVMSGIVEMHQGSVEKFIGDAVMAVFGVPAVHEDDALRARRAGVEMQAAFPAPSVMRASGSRASWPRRSGRRRSDCSWSLSPLRRRDHVLAGRRGREAAGRVPVRSRSSRLPSLAARRDRLGLDRYDRKRNVAQAVVVRDRLAAL